MSQPVRNSSELPENTVVVYVRGGQVQWSARGAGRRVDVIVVDGDRSDFPEPDEPQFRVWGEPCEPDVIFDHDIAVALGDFFETSR